MTAFIQHSLIILALILCAGCQSVKQPEHPTFFDIEESISLVIEQVGDQYSVDGSWNTKRMVEYGLVATGDTEMVSTPTGIGYPNQWITCRMVELYENMPSLEVLVDNELVEVPQGFGSTLKVLIMPLNENQVIVKGVVSTCEKTDSFSQHQAVPFSGTFNLGEPRVIYSRKDKGGTEKAPICPFDFPPLSDARQ